MKSIKSFLAMAMLIGAFSQFAQADEDLVPQLNSVWAFTEGASQFQQMIFTPYRGKILVGVATGQGEMTQTGPNKVVFKFNFPIVSMRIYEKNKEQFVDVFTCRTTVAKGKEGGLILTSIEQSAWGCPNGLLQKVQVD